MRDPDDESRAVSAGVPEVDDLGYAELESSLAAFADLHFRITADGTYVRVWAADPTDLVVPADQIPGTNVADHFPPSLTKRILDAITVTIATSEVTAVEYSLGEGDEVNYFEARLAPLGDNEVMAVVRDVTGLKELEQQLLHAETMQSIGRLAGGIAHDFNNVLHVIRGHAGALRRHCDDATEIDRRLEAITRAVDRTSSLVERLMILSRPTVNNPTPTAVDSFLRGLGPSLSQLLGETIELEFVLGSGDAVVVIDDSRFENVLLNLATNAHDAMPEGGALRIVTSLKGDDGSVVLTVSDTGVGIDPEVVEQVFEPFFTNKTTGVGTGLGLATTYSSIADAGGSISVDSALGSGTSFTIVLPTTDDRPEPIALEGRITKHRTNATILVVEDEADVLELCGDALRDLGFSVLEAANGWEALDFLDGAEGGVDLVLTDVVMPAMSGPDLAHQIAQRGHDVAVLFMSGYAEEAHVDGRGIGPSEVLRKPFTEEQLWTAISVHLADVEDEDER